MILKNSDVTWEHMPSMRFRAFIYASLFAFVFSGLFRCREEGSQRGGRYILCHEGTEQKKIDEESGDIWKDGAT